MSAHRETSEERDALAGEYVLGLIEGTEFEALSHRAKHDADFARRIEYWRQHLGAIDLSAAPVAPSAKLWTRIEAELGSSMRPLRPSPLLAKGLSTWWQSLSFWRGAALAGALASLALAVGFMTALDRARRQPEMVAVLLTEANAVAAVVNTFADGRVELVSLDDIRIPQGRALQIWTLWDRAVGPRSVGLIDQARSTALDLANSPIRPDQLFEITIEAAGGSPTGRPTGPIVAKGLTTRRL